MLVVLVVLLKQTTVPNTIRCSIAATCIPKCTVCSKSRGVAKAPPRPWDSPMKYSHPRWAPPMGQSWPRPWRGSLYYQWLSEWGSMWVLVKSLTYKRFKEERCEKVSLSICDIRLVCRSLEQEGKNVTTKLSMSSWQLQYSLHHITSDNVWACLRINRTATKNPKNIWSQNLPL